MSWTDPDPRDVAMFADADRLAAAYHRTMSDDPTKPDPLDPDAPPDPDAPDPDDTDPTV
jgi:hypothetical protein